MFSRREFLSLTAALATGTVSIGTGYDDHPKYPVLSDDVDAWVKKDQYEKEIPGLFGTGKLRVSATEYEHASLNAVVEDVIGDDLTVPMAGLVLFRIGQEGSQWTIGDRVIRETDNRLGATTLLNGALYKSQVRELYRAFLNDFSEAAHEEEGRIYNGLADLPGSDAMTIAQALRDTTDESVNVVEHDTSAATTEFNLSYVISEEIAEESSRYNPFGPSGKMDAKGWLANWAHDGYIIGTGAVHPRIRPSGTSSALGDQTYLEDTLSEYTDGDVELNVREQFDREVIRTFGKVEG
jgi:hypothetical protein